jgi:arylsulfatase A-like enzyme
MSLARRATKQDTSANGTWLTATWWEQCPRSSEVVTNIGWRPTCWSSCPAPTRRPSSMSRTAIRYLAQPRQNPFFLFLSFLEPHHQNHLDDYPPPHGYRERYTGRWIPPDLAALGGSAHQHLGGYYGMVKRLDEALGRLLDALTSLQLREKTIVVFTSDHGCHFKTRNDEYKRSCHDSSIRVPAAIQGPRFDGGGQVRHLVSLLDLPPTLLAAAGLPAPKHMVGRSLLPLLRGGEANWPDDHFVQISESQVGRAIRTQRWKYGVTDPAADGWDDSHSDRYQEQYLYDLQADPYELCNLVGLESHRRVANVLQGRLKRRMVQAGEAAPQIIPAPVREAPQRRVSEAEAHM